MEQSGNHGMALGVTRRQLAFAAAACCGVCVLAADPAAAAPPPEADLAQAFHALRNVRGHFDGGAWNNDVDRWQGRKHQVMQALAQQMLRERASAAQLRQAMGEPDALLTAGQPAHTRAIEQAQWQGVAGGKATALWLYRWRGTHDQLVLALEHDRVAAAGWLYQWE
jgi:hypothetical protein